VGTDDFFDLGDLLAIDRYFLGCLHSLHLAELGRSGAAPLRMIV